MSASSHPASGAFSSFAAPGYPILWWGGTFSFISVQMQFLLRGLLAWELTEREGALGLTYLCFGITLLLATPLGGVATDRLPRRTVLVVSQGILALVAVLLGAAVLSGHIQFWMLLAAGVAQGTSFAFFGPARVAMASELVGRDQLGNAITLSLLSMNGTRVFAPAVAGVLAGVPTIGMGGTYLIAAVFSAVSFVFLLRVPSSPPAAPASAPAGAGFRYEAARAFDETRAGVAYVRARPELRRLIVSSFFVIMFGFNYVAFYPAMIEGVFGLGETWVGYISSASALGAVLVSVPLAARADSAWAKAVMTVAGLCFGAGVMVFGVSANFWMAFVVIFFVGMATTTYQSLSNTLALGMADDAHQGRVQSLMQLSFAGFGIAALPLGGLAEIIGLRLTIVAMGAVAATSATLYALREGGWHSLRPDVRPPPARPPATTAADTVASLELDDDLTRSPATGA